MQEYYFLFSLAGIWLVFAAIQDLRTTEISNWLNFSLIAFALSYRAFYAVYSKNPSFFLYGLGGFLLFVALAYAFYYGRVFAGGDAKLLMGMGAILPFESFGSYASITLSFIFLLFLVGAIYSLAYSVYLSAKEHKKFTAEFKKRLKKSKSFVISFIAIGVVSLAASLFLASELAFISIIVIIFPFVMLYVKSVESACMIRLVNPKDLMEGDWIEGDVKVGGKVIKKTVHGLSEKEIELLKKSNKKVLVKFGVPFGPAFLLAFLVFVAFYLRDFPFQFNYFTFYFALFFN